MLKSLLLLLTLFLSQFLLGFIHILAFRSSVCDQFPPAWIESFGIFADDGHLG